MAKEVEIFKKGKRVSHSRNLRGLAEYHRVKSPVSRSTIKKTSDGGGVLKVRFMDGAHAETKFASYTVLKDWVKMKRKRSGWA